MPDRLLPPGRARVVAFLRGVAAALGEDGSDLYRYPGGPLAESWWQRGYDWTQTVTLHRWDVYTCTDCGRRVHNPDTAEHDPACPSNHRA